MLTLDRRPAHAPRIRCPFPHCGHEDDQSRFGFYALPDDSGRFKRPHKCPRCHQWFAPEDIKDLAISR